MRKLNSMDLLKFMIELLTSYLEELSDVQDLPDQEFSYGEKTAYTECLEILSRWESAKENGLDYEVEKRFPLT